jgi:acetolactate synthase-1/2/3 large subunit
MVTGDAKAAANSIPGVVITTDDNSAIAGRGVSQECDQVAVLRQFTKASFRIDQTKKIPEILRNAFRIAVSGRPGPVHLDMPEDILQGTEDFTNQLFSDIDCHSYPARRPAPEQTRVNQAVQLLSESERPVILAGGGVMLSQAWEETVQLCKLLGAPVATTITGKGAIPETHPLSVGTIGRQGFRETADKAVEESDVLLAVGCKFAQVATDNWTLINPATKLIHIDIDPAEIGRIYPATVSITADAKLALRTLVEGLKARSSKASSKHSEWLQRISAAKKGWLDSVSPVRQSDSVPIKPQRLVTEIRNTLSDDGIFVSDTSFTGAFTACYYDVRKVGRTYLQHRGMAGIGDGLPAAIGAKCAAGDRVVVGMGGDGGFAYHVSELETAKRHGLNVVYAISNNSSLGWIKYLQEKHYSRRVMSTEYGPIDFVKVAEGYGCFGKLVERPSEIQPALREAIRAGTPGIINVLVDPGEVPPIGRKTTYAVAQ